MQAYFIGLAAGLVVAGGALLWLRARWLARAAAADARAEGLEAALQAARAQAQTLQGALDAARERQAGQQARIVELETLLAGERQEAQARAALLAHAEQRLAETFRALSAQALQGNNVSFLALARENLAQFQEAARGDLAARQQAVEALLAPVREALERLGGQTRELEQARARDFGDLGRQLHGLAQAQAELRQETARLVTALRRPEVRGRWGEVQLRRVVELAGMLEHCDFAEQQVSDEGARPDMVMRLPGGKQVVLDAKTPLAAYLEALEAPDDGARAEALASFARHVREHVQRLAAKTYWQQFQPAPEFVVMFLPGEAFFSAALREDAELIEFAAQRRVILAAPTTLLALLKAVYHGWREAALADNARQISELGARLYQRLARLGEHWQGVGKGLGQAVRAYNEASASLEGRVLVTAREFAALRAAPAGATLAAPAPVEQVPRELRAPELFGDLREP
jgi:DNA recombination protein RmuC